jgi:hypothetical protein
MYSQAWQDEFVDFVLDHPTTGFFVDVGAGYDEVADGKINSNSLMFEQRGWNGICIDGDIKRMLGRKTAVEAFLGPSLTLAEVLAKHNCPTLVDYLSIDVDGLDVAALRSFIDGGYQFKVLTIEHDLSTGNPGVYQNKFDIFSCLAQCGCVRLVENVGHQAVRTNLHAGNVFEDWYINTQYVNYQEAKKKIEGLSK